MNGVIYSMASGTKNLGLTTFNENDLVDYHDFNGNWNKIDELGKDYVIDQGYAGNKYWWYRKWKSGRAECGVDNMAFSGTTALNNWMSALPTGGLFYSNKEYTFGNYPIQFQRRPYADCKVNYIGGSNSGIYVFTIQKSQIGGQTSPSFRIVTTTSGVLEGVQCSIYCVGAWAHDPQVS